MSARPVATVVIATYNRPHLVHRAVRSALSQSVPDIEVIVVDDGSDEPIRPLTSDRRLRIHRLDRHNGANPARNLGLAEARGRWITFLDDDDELLPNMIGASLEAAGRSTLPPPISVLSVVEVLGEDGTILERRLPVSLPLGSHYSLEPPPPGRSFLTQNTLLTPREVLERLGGWDEDIGAWDHDDLFLRLNAATSFQGTDVATYRMHDHAGPRQHRNLIVSADSIRKTLDKHRAIFRHHRRRRAGMTGAAGIYYLRGGLWGPAFAETSKALLLNPASPKLYAWWAASVLGPRLSLPLVRTARRLNAFIGRPRDGSEEEDRPLP